MYIIRELFDDTFCTGLPVWPRYFCGSLLNLYSARHDNWKIKVKCFLINTINILTRGSEKKFCNCFSLLRNTAHIATCPTQHMRYVCMMRKVLCHMASFARLTWFLSLVAQRNNNLFYITTRAEISLGTSIRQTLAQSRVTLLWKTL